MPAADAAAVAVRRLMPFVAVMVAALLVHRFVAFTTVVRSDSMRPALEPGDLLLTTRMHRGTRLRRGDIVVFRAREVGTTLVKRLVGLPGDHVEFADGGIVLRNGERLDEPDARRSGSYRGDFTVPAGHLFVLGDDRAASSDSRSWGRPYVAITDVLGIVRSRPKLRPRPMLPSVRRVAVAAEA